MLYSNQPSAPDICLKESSQWTSYHKSYVLNFCSGHFFIQNRMLSKGGSKGKTGCSQLSGGAKTRGEFSKHLASLVCNTISQSCSTSKSSSYYADEEKWSVFNNQNPAYCYFCCFVLVVFTLFLLLVADGSGIWENFALEKQKQEVDEKGEHKSKDLTTII